MQPATSYSEPSSSRGVAEVNPEVTWMFGTVGLPPQPEKRLGSHDDSGTCKDHGRGLDHDLVCCGRGLGRVAGDISPFSRTKKSPANLGGKFTTREHQIPGGMLVVLFCRRIGTKVHVGIKFHFLEPGPSKKVELFSGSKSRPTENLDVSAKIRLKGWVSIFCV